MILINYIIENEINGILGELENKSIQDTIKTDEGNWTVDEGEWTIDGEQVQVGNNVRIIKRDMNQITKQIK